MAATYSGGANPSIDWPRLLISDTGPTFIFQDSEIQSAYLINSMQFQSGQFYSGPGGQNFPTCPSNYLRAAALLLNALASNAARLANVAELLDVKLSGAAAVKALQDTAQRYLDMDDNSGAFFIAEQCQTVWGFRDRFWAQIQRQSGGMTTG